MPARHKFGLQGCGLGIKTGVPNCGIGFTGAGPNIGCGFQQDNPQALAHKSAGNRAADDAATDHRDVVGLLHAVDYRPTGSKLLRGCHPAMISTSAPGPNKPRRVVAAIPSAVAQSWG